MKARYVILAAALAGAAATFLPWESYDRFSVDGRASLGWMSFGAFVAAAACALYKPTWWIRGALVFAAAIAVSAPTIKLRQLGLIESVMAVSSDVEQRRLAIQLHPGHGVYLVIGCSLVLVLGAMIWRRPRPGEQPPPKLPRATLRT